VSAGRRGQASLVAVAVGVVLVVAAAGLGVTLADEALRSADREPVERRAATGLVDRIASANATSRRPGLLRAGVRNLTAAEVDALAPAVRNRPVRVRLDGRTVLERGRLGGATTVRRVVGVARPTAAERSIELADRTNLTLPPGVGRVRVYVRAGNNTTVTALFADGRPVLHADGGIEGTAVVRLDRRGRTDLRVGIDGPARGVLRVNYVRVEREPATLEVSVGARG
jgi:hypothetical protein